MKSASPRLEALEDRYLLSAVGVRSHLPAGAAAALSSRAVAGPSEDRSTPGIHSQSSAVQVEEGGSSTPISQSPALTSSETAAATGEQGNTAVKSSQNGEGEDVAAALALSAAQGKSSGTSTSTAASAASSAARTLANADPSASDESSQLGRGTASSASSSSSFEPGATTGDEETLALQMAVDRPQEAARSATAGDGEAAPVIGATTGTAARVTITVAVADASKISAATPPDASPAIPADRAHAASPSLARNQPSEGPSANLAPDETGTSPQDQRLSSCGADLIASFSPFDRAQVERAIDQLLDRLDALETGLSRLGTTTNLIPSLTATALAIAVMEVFHRRLGQRSDENQRGVQVLAVGDNDNDNANDQDTDTCFPGLPGLPHHWSLEQR
jgi:hypothetical protein